MMMPRSRQPGGPGAYLGQGNRLSQLLAQQPDPNNGTHLGGLGSVLQRGLQGYMAGDEQRRTETTLAQALQAMQGRPADTIEWSGPRPDGTGEMRQAVPAQPGNRDLAAMLLAQNPGTAPMGWDMAMRNADLEHETAQAAAQREAEQETWEQRFGMTNDAQRRRDETAFEYQQRLARLDASLRPPPAPPSSIQEYEYARANGYGGSFEQYRTDVQRAGASNVNVQNMGNIPPGYRVIRDEQGNPVSMEPIAGGPADVEAREAEQTRDNRQEMIARAGGTVVQDIGRGMAILDGSDWSAGPAAVALVHVPGSSAWLLNQYLESVRSNIGVDQLRQMREASPTGGALGQVPFQQQIRLEQLLGSLDIRQPAPVLRDNMRRISNLYMDTIHGTPDHIAQKVAAGEISAEDAITEGIDYELHRCGCEVCSRTSIICPATASSLILDYAALWNSIHTTPGRRWDDNPWVVAYTFEARVGNIDGSEG